jgi:hypothetical protein
VEQLERIGEISTLANDNTEVLMRIAFCIACFKVDPAKVANQTVNSYRHIVEYQGNGVSEEKVRSLESVTVKLFKGIKLLLFDYVRVSVDKNIHKILANSFIYTNMESMRGYAYCISNGIYVFGNKIF